MGAYAPALAASSLLAFLSLRGVLQRVGHPAFPLDDAFIHLQYARRLAEGAFFEYVAGQGYSSGATSLLWPLLLAPFSRVGLGELQLAWAVWGLGTVVHAALVLETQRLARPLVGRMASLAAAASAWAFGAFAWFAWSGMETLLLGWALLRAARLAAERCEGVRAPEGPSASNASNASNASSSRASPSFASLFGLSLLGPLIRPEGALVSLLCATALVVAPPTYRGRPRLWTRALGLLALAPIGIVPGLHLAFAGHAVSSTATAKWLLGNPWWAERAPELVRANVKLLFRELLAGGSWTAIFLPEGSRVPILGGLCLLPLAARRSRRPWRAAFVALVAAGALIPCTYLTFLDNRVRYLWPFAGAWLVLAAVFVRELAGGLQLCLGGLRLRRLSRASVQLTPLLGFGMAGALATKLPWTLRDLAESAHAIDRQQVTLARWVAEHLPLEARVGVNDTGALAYLGKRPTFDVVGLTTEGEARYWAAGAGPRFEHYERLAPERRPTHWVVYPQWLDCPPLLGRPLHEVTVTEQSILGGPTMVVHEARWDLVDTGERPRSLHPDERVVDALDVAELESEQAHAYDLRGAYPSWTVASLLASPEGELADGGRTHRTFESFELQLPRTGGHLLARLGAPDGPVRVRASAGGRPLGSVELEQGQTEELRFALPAELSGRVRIELQREGASDFTSYHAWSVASGP